MGWHEAHWRYAGIRSRSARVAEEVESGRHSALRSRLGGYGKRTVPPSRVPSEGPQIQGTLYHARIGHLKANMRVKKIFPGITCSSLGYTTIDANLRGQTFWASADDACRRANVEAPDNEASLRAMGYRTPALPPMNPFFYDPCELLDTKDITEGAIARPEQMFGPMQTAARKS